MGRGARQERVLFTGFEEHRPLHRNGNTVYALNSVRNDPKARRAIIQCLREAPRAFTRIVRHSTFRLLPIGFRLAAATTRQTLARRADQSAWRGLVGAGAIAGAEPLAWRAYQPARRV